MSFQAFCCDLVVFRCCLHSTVGLLKYEESQLIKKNGFLPFSDWRGRVRDFIQYSKN